MWRRLLGLGAAFASLVSPAQAQTHAQAATGAPVSAKAAPANWIRYAKLVEQQFKDRLGGDSMPAQRLRTYLNAGTQAQSVALPVRVWIDPAGKVTRIAFAPFPDARANADLTGLLQGAVIARPPKDMALPIHLKLAFAAANEAVTPTSGSAPPPKH